ncbi:hypothetical protein BY996DRAFT_7559583 [Phakopsora pachyrhizi]|nr:hypothetical protein BY996DRAFT_7559583 [Phakopsora pachyrhizi]
MWLKRAAFLSYTILQHTAPSEPPGVFIICQYCIIGFHQGRENPASSEILSSVGRSVARSHPQNILQAWAVCEFAPVTAFKRFCIF